MKGRRATGKAAGRLRLVWINLLRDRRAALLSLVGVAAGVGCLLFFLAAGVGVGEVVETRILPVDARLVEVVPPKVSLGIFGKVELDEERVDQLASLQGVSRVYRKMQIRTPAVSRYDGSFFGQRLRMGLEIVGEGVEPGLLSEDLGEVEFEDGDGAIPFVVSPRLLEIYNKSFAKMRKLPQLNPSVLEGFEIPLEFGRSYVTSRAAAGERVVASGRLVGFSNRSMIQGITVPLDTARRLNQRFGEDATTYSSVVLQAKDPGEVPKVIEEVRRLGFEVDDGERQLSQRVGAIVAITSATLSLLGLLICALASLNIALSLGASVRNRSRELGILRAVGATSADIAGLVLGEALIIGLVGGLLGSAGAFALAKLVDGLAGAWLPDFPFKPETFFAFSPWLFLAGLGIGIVAALLGALAPTRRAIRQDPARTMA